MLGLKLNHVSKKDPAHKLILSLMTILSWSSLMFGYCIQFQWMNIDWSLSGKEIYKDILLLQPPAMH